MDIDDIKEVTYDRSLKKLTINGRMFNDYTINFRSIDKIKARKLEVGTVVIYDYFSPSLIDTLRYEYNIKIVEV